MATMNITLASWDMGFYAIGVAALLLIYLPFSPMTIDLVNFSRDTQIAIYRRRHTLWAIAGICLGAVLLRALVDILGASGALDAGPLPGSVGSPHTTWLWRVEGPLSGQTLAALSHFSKLFWFSWALFKPGTRVNAAAAH